MPRFLPLSVALSTATISSLLSFSTAKIAHSYPICYMINSSGQVVNLDYLCGKKIATANICQEPVNRKGLPLSVARELEHIKVNSRKVMAGLLDADVGADFLAMIDQLAFPARIQDLIQKQKLLAQQRKQALQQYNVPQAKKLDDIYKEITKALDSDPCYSRIMKAIERNTNSI